MKKITTTLTLIILLTSSNVVHAQKQRKTHALQGAKIGALSLGTASALSYGIAAAYAYDCSGPCPLGNSAVLFFVGSFLGGAVGAATGAIIGGGIGALIPNKSNIQINPLILNQADGMYSGASVNLRF